LISSSDLSPALADSQLDVGEFAAAADANPPVRNRIRCGRGDYANDRKELDEEFKVGIGNPPFEDTVLKYGINHNSIKDFIVHIVQHIML
jgi:hypothetical protein